MFLVIVLNYHKLGKTIVVYIIYQTLGCGHFFVHIRFKQKNCTLDWNCYS